MQLPPGLDQEALRSLLREGTQTLADAAKAAQERVKDLEDQRAAIERERWLLLKKVDEMTYEILVAERQATKSQHDLDTVLAQLPNIQFTVEVSADSLKAVYKARGKLSACKWLKAQSGKSLMECHAIIEKMGWGDDV